MEGLIEAEESLQISGRFKGNIDIPSQEGVVRPDAIVEADIVANQVLIQGRVRGNVKAQASSALASSANMVGKLETHELKVEEGAVFRGQVDILN